MDQHNKKNKRTSCSSKSKSGITFETNDDAIQNFHLIKSNTTNINVEVSSGQEVKKLSQYQHNEREIGNYNKDQFPKELTKLSNSISKNKQQDHSFSRINAQILQTKAAYFPGKTFKEIRQALISTKGNNLLVDKMNDQNNCNFFKRICKKKEIFGKHLITRKRIKKMKLLNSLNTIEEVTESEESLKRTRFNKEDENSSIALSYTCTDNSKENSIFLTTPIENTVKSDTKFVTKFQKKEIVAYMFQRESNNSKSTKKSIEWKTKKSNQTVSKVFQIRDMFESMSRKKETNGEPKFLNNEEDKIYFKHGITCEECKRMLNNIMKSNETSEKEKNAALTQLPENVAKEIMGSLIFNINEESKKKLERKKKHNNHVLKMRRGFNRNKNYNSGNFKKFLLLALAISVVLYCFYCRLHEKKKI